MVLTRRKTVTAQAASAPSPGRGNLKLDGILISDVDIHKVVTEE